MIGDVLSEVYGFRATRRAIFIGFAMEALAALVFWVTIYLPPADFYENQAAFEAVVGAFTQLIVAGLAGFIVGQTVNAWTVVRDQGPHQGEASVGPADRVDGRRPVRRHVVFCSIAAGAIGITTCRRLPHLRRAGLAVQDGGRGRSCCRLPTG